MEVVTKQDVSVVFNNYPSAVREKMELLRQMILDTAKENECPKIVETLKWGEPSYVVKGGSTVRIDWKKSNPDFAGVYFICSTSLVSTFRVIYSELFTFQENRAILLPLSGEIPGKELCHCISLAFNYHRLKDLPLLGE